jgi:hypothetical protein
MSARNTTTARAKINNVVDTSRLRDLLNQIILYFHGNQKFMRKTRSTLLKLLHEFAQSEIKRGRKSSAEPKARKDSAPSTAPVKATPSERLRRP